MSPRPALPWRALVAIGGDGLKASLLVLPLILVVAYGVVATSASPGPAEMAVFGPAGAHLLTGHWSAVYAGAANQGGPFELVPYGAAHLLGLSGRPAWTAYYALWMFVMTVAIAVAARVIAPAASSWRLYRTAAAGGIACLVGLVPTAFDVGHPAQLMVPMMWVLAGCAARDRRFALAGALVGLSMGWEVWGILGAPVLFCGTRPRYRPAALALAGSAAAIYLPFMLSGGFAMFSFAWPVRPGTFIHLIAPQLTAFPWTLRLLQASVAVGGGLAVAFVTRRSPHRLWLVPLAVLGLRLLFDPCLYTYYWIAPGVVLVAGLALTLSVQRLWAFAGLALFTVWVTKVATRGVADTAWLLALTAFAALLCGRPARAAMRLTLSPASR